MKVFIVDDSAIILARLVTLLTTIPDLEIVGAANNTKDAKHALQTLRPDVLLLDIQMPGGSGLKLLRQLKQESYCPLILIISGNSFAQYRKKCLAAGADYFFDKSIELEQLQATLYDLVPQFRDATKARE